jgi:outer membrane protein TolC
LATLPDLLEAQAESAQADFDLQAAIGALESAQGDLATVLGLPAHTQIQVENINDLSIPDGAIKSDETTRGRFIADFVTEVE